MPISASQAQTSIKKIWNNAASLNPNSLISLYEIDVDTIALDQGLILNNDDTSIFRFHNHIKLTNNSIIFQGKEFIAAPIVAEGFEVNARGTLPTPKLAITVNEDGIDFLSLLKERMKVLGDLAGAKVTRIRTFAKYLDATNWPLGETPDDFEPDPYAEFPRDVYYIDRKSNENKFTIEFELASILDLEGLKLPARMIYAKRCVAQYRGEGCCYEYTSRHSDDIHGDATLPQFAPPVANDRDEKITTIIGINRFTEPTVYDANKLSSYIKGSGVFITKNGINYYFVCKVNGPTAGPPDTRYWVADNCSKSLIGCRLRWGTDGAVNVGNSGLVKGQLPFVAFPACDKIR